MTIEGDMKRAGRIRTLSAEGQNLYSTAVTRAVRSFTDVGKLQDAPGPVGEVLSALAVELAADSLIPGVLRYSPEWATGEVLERLRTDCSCSVDEDGLVRNNKRNAPVASPLLSLLFEEFGLLARVCELTGLTTLKAVSATYIVYDEPGARLELHIDRPSYGDINILMRIDEPRSDADADALASATVFIGPDGVRREPLEAGEAIIFDGTAALHGRSPLLEGETVRLLSIGFSYNED